MVVTARQKERASETDGRKACPFGTCARPHPGQVPLAVPITVGVGNSRCVFPIEAAAGPRGRYLLDRWHAMRAKVPANDVVGSLFL